jgi:hypothetical protein
MNPYTEGKAVEFSAAPNAILGCRPCRNRVVECATGVLSRAEAWRKVLTQRTILRLDVPHIREGCRRIYCLKSKKTGQ